MNSKNSENKIEKLEAELNLLKAELNYDNIIKQDKKSSKNVKETILYQWKAPSRVYQKWDKQKLYTVFLWLLVIIILLVFIKQYFTIIVVLALGFVIYAMTNYPPHEVEHTITDQNVVWFEKNTYIKICPIFGFHKEEIT